MHVSRTTSVERGLDRIFSEAGINLVWYRYSGTASNLPEFGLGVSTTYHTAYIRGLLAAARPEESQLPGGAYEQGMVTLKTRELVGKDDMLDIGIMRYRVFGVPQQVVLGPTLFYQHLMRRAE